MLKEINTLQWHTGPVEGESLMIWDPGVQAPFNLVSADSRYSRNSPSQKESPRIVDFAIVVSWCQTGQMPQLV